MARAGVLSKADQRDVMRFIVQNHEYIVSKWTSFYGGIEAKFYC